MPKVRELMNRNVIHCSPEDSISKALSKMEKYKLHQLPVLAGNELKGMLILKNIITKTFDPVKAKVRHFITPVPKINVKEGVGGVAKTLLDSAMKALPVMDNRRLVGIISEVDLIKLVKTIKSVGSVASKSKVVKKGEPISKATTIMHEYNVSRVPVVDDGKVIGVVDELSLIKLFRGKQAYEARGGMRSKRGKSSILAGFKQKQRLDKIPVEDFMKEPFIANEETPITDLIKPLQEREEIIIENFDGSIGIVTPKDVIELLVGEGEKVYVQITNLGDETSFTKIKVYDVLEEFVRKMGKMFKNIQYLFLHVEKHKKQGARKTKYSVRTRFHVTPGIFVSRAWGWDLVTATQEAMSKLEREVMRKWKIKIEHPKRREIK